MKANIQGIVSICVLLLAVIFITEGIRWVNHTYPVEAQGRSGVACGSSAVISVATAATTSLVALVAAQRIVVCGFVVNGAGATTIQFVRGTGATCGTGTAAVTGAMKLIDGSSIPYGGGVGEAFKLPVGERLCLTNSAAVQVSGVVSYGYAR